MISIMNGVHCQTSTITMDQNGQRSTNAIGVEAEGLEEPVEDAERGAEHLVLPHQAGHHRHDQEWRDEQRAGEALTEELAVEQERQDRADEQRQQHGRRSSSRPRP